MEKLKESHVAEEWGMGRRLSVVRCGKQGLDYTGLHDLVVLV